MPQAAFPMVSDKRQACIPCYPTEYVWICYTSQWHRNLFRPVRITREFVAESARNVRTPRYRLLERSSRWPRFCWYERY